MWNGSKKQETSSKFHLKEESGANISVTCTVTNASSLCCRVNLALAYTELTEELGRVRDLAIKQSDLLRQVSQEPGQTRISGLTWFLSAFLHQKYLKYMGEVMSERFPLLLFTLQFLVRIPPPSDSPRPPRSEPRSPLTGSSPPPLPLCPPPLPALPPTPTSRPAAVSAPSSRAVGVTLRSALSRGFTLKVDSTSVFTSFTLPLCAAGIGPLSHPESSGSSKKGPCVHPSEAQVPAGGDARLWPDQSSAPDLCSGSGQASFGSRSWGRERRRRRRRRGGERWGQQSEQQSSSLSSGPGFPPSCRGNERFPQRILFSFSRPFDTEKDRFERFINMSRGVGYITSSHSRL